MKTISEKNKAIVAVCSIAFLTLVSSATSPALEVIGQNFPDASKEAISSIATLSTLTSVPFTILSGLLLGKKIKFRTANFIGLFFTFFGGVLPFFATTITQVLIGRAILGMGEGISIPVSTCLVLSIFKGDDISKQFSRNSMATNVGAVIFQLAGGYLCNYNWNLPFTVYFLVIPVIIITLLWMPEPKEAVATDIQTVKNFKISKIITKHVLFWAFFYGIYMLWFYAYVTQTSSIIINNDYGNSTTAAVVLSLFTLVGVGGGASFYGLQKKFGVKSMTIGLVVSGIAFIFLANAKSIYTYTFFSLMFGFGYGVIQPAVTYFLGIGLEDDYRAASISFANIITSFGSFGSAYAVKYSKILFHTTWERTPFVVGFVFFLVLGIMFMFIKTPQMNEEMRI